MLIEARAPSAPAIPRPTVGDVQRALVDAASTIQRSALTSSDPTRRAQMLRERAAAYRASATRPGACVPEVAVHWALVAKYLDMAAVGLSAGLRV